MAGFLQVNSANSTNTSPFFISDAPPASTEAEAIDLSLSSHEDVVRFILANTTYADSVRLTRIDEKNTSAIINLYFDMLVNLSAKERSSFLLELERILIIADTRYRLWINPIGDKNSLRNLRGVKVG